ncbi:MBL fold metallo-hydrolase [Mesorhizobium ciceri]|uniref:MBL fold metallo-hydrolase n=1 Tax=Mesorhizobium TaxID=68287 RepID=UPI0004B04DF4|nr:MBL fold metallo-hydrolase [Mesorhizobium ciceri]
MARRPARREAQSFACHLLNMGRTKYGDCIVVECGGMSILIDGGHPGDWKGNEYRPSIPTQLEQIVGSQAPYHFDLLVVTHCHQDHIGCLPKLIAEGIVTCDRALVADEKLGFGIDDQGGSDARVTAAPERIRRLVAALSEEDHSNLRGPALEEFLSDSALLQDGYDAMLVKLARNADITRYRGLNGLDPLINAMSPSGMQILGPTTDQLVHCAETIQRVSGDAVDLLADFADANESAAETYLRLMASESDAADEVSHEIGWAKNCQSIILTFGSEDTRILLPGDMQFAEPGIAEIDRFVHELRDSVKRAGPFVFAKLPHHTSHNGINQDILTEWQWPPLLGHSGGFNDPKHPDASTLDLLKRLARQHDFQYGRTDRNGLVTIYPAQNKMEGQGRLNDFTPNVASDEAGELAVAEQALAAGPSVAITSSSEQFIDITFARIPYAEGRVSIDGRVIEISRPRHDQPARQKALGQPGSDTPKPEPARPSHDNALAAGRPLPQLLFVTDAAKLRQNVGEDADRAIQIVERAGHRVVSASGAALITKTRLAMLEGKPKGVIILGGYDVVPSQRIDVLGPDLRARIPANLIARDKDGFIVWSDDVYGDIEPDGVPELPVSRIPDARLGSFFLSQLTQSGIGQAGRYGLRNSARPFADAVYANIPGNEAVQISSPQQPSAQQRQLAAREYAYFMLHGDYRNSTVFWGEDDGGNLAAIDIPSLPASGIGVAFAGCCWGALTVSDPALLSNGQPTPRMVERSMALSILKAGARAFVGATGVHYSPGARGGFFGGPLHAAFWDEIRRGISPAEALFNARHTYLLDIPHGRTALWDLAVERKLYKQFTCLGLGW